MGYRKLGRTSSQRKAMLRDLATDLNHQRTHSNNRSSCERITFCC